MTTADWLIVLARANLAASAAVLAVLALRPLTRRWFGAHCAYRLWLLAPLAAVGALIPAQGSPGWAGAMASAADAGRWWLAGAGRPHDLATLWLAGLAANVALAAWRQARFAAAERAGRAGPAVVGVIAPRLVAPADFADRFTDAERRLIRAHELAHIDRRDSRLGALALAAAWICWFNPLAHVALAAFRRDQEVACDATVVERLPRERRAYAETMLRTQPLARRLVFGCAWLAAEHPLATRLTMLARRPPSQPRRDAGLAALVALSAVSFGGAWSARPAPLRAYAQPLVILLDVSPPDAQVTARVYRWWPQLARAERAGRP